MCLLFVYLSLKLSLKYATSYPYTDHILVYIPIEELAYLSPQNVVTIPAPYYNNAFFYDPWCYQPIMMQNVRSPFRQTTGPVTFGGQTKAQGAVKIKGHFGNQGFGTFTSYSAPPTPLAVTSQPLLPTTSSLLMDTLPTTSSWMIDTLPTTSSLLMDTFPTTSSLLMDTFPTTSSLLMNSLPSGTPLPTLTTLPEVILPSTDINQPFIDTMPSTVSVPTTPMPFIMVTTTVPTDVGLNGNIASPVKFSGMVPASGRVKISAHFG